MVTIPEDRHTIEERGVILAKKTLEIVHVVNIAKLILDEKFHNDSTQWLEALFHALKLENPVYLQEELRSAGSESCEGVDQADRSFFERLNDQILELFERYADLSSGERADNKDFLDTSFKLIRLFNKFVTMLLQYKMPLSVTKDLIFYLKQIQDDIGTYLSTCYKFDNRNSAARSATEPSTEYESAEIFGGHHNELRSSTSSNSPEDMGVAEVATSIAPPPPNMMICEECNAEVVIFNNNVEFSMSLHAEELVHKNAMVRACYQDEDSDYDQQSVRYWLDAKVKEHSSYIEIVSKSLFYCTLCKLNVGGKTNLSRHVYKGRTHIIRHNQFVKESEACRGWTSNTFKKRFARDSENELNLVEYERIQENLRKDIADHINFMEIVSKREIFCHLCDLSIAPIREVKAHVSGEGHQTKIRLNPSLHYCLN